MLINSARVRFLISECKTEPEIIATLRRHKIRYTFAIDTGSLNIRIHCRKGFIRIYRTASRSFPFAVRYDVPKAQRVAQPFAVPVLNNDY